MKLLKFWTLIAIPRWRWPLCGYHSRASQKNNERKSEKQLIPKSQTSPYILYRLRFGFSLIILHQRERWVIISISLIQRVTALQGQCPDFPVPEWCASTFSALLSCWNAPAALLHLRWTRLQTAKQKHECAADHVQRSPECLPGCSAVPEHRWR